MKSRKLISFLGAAAMAASAFSGLTLTASAAEPVWSYDGNIDNVAEVWPGGDSTSTVSTVEDAQGEYTQFTIKELGASTYKFNYELPDEAKLSDNYVIEYDVMMHQSNGMQRVERYNQVAFISADATTDTRDFVAYAKAYNAEHGSGANEAAGSGEGYTTGVASSVSMIYGMASAQINATNDTALQLNEDTSGIVSDKWYRVQTAVTGTTATVNVIDAAGNEIVKNGTYTNSADTLDNIFVTVGRGDAGVTGQGVVCLDNMKIYSGTAEALTTDGLRGEAEIETPATTEPTAAPAAAPAITAPDTAVAGMNENFNSYQTGTLISMTADEQQPYTGIEGLSIAVGDRKDGDATSYASIDENVSADNVLKLASGRFSNNSKGPVVTLTDNLAITAATDPTSVMAFAVKLSSTGTVPGKMYLLDNLTNVDGNTVARDIMAVLTTEEDASGYANGDTAIGVSLEADKWYSVVVTVSPDSNAAVYGSGKTASTYRVYVFDSEGNNVTGAPKDPVIKGEKVNSGENSVSVNNLPVIATAQVKEALGSGNASIGTIDNLITYTTTSTEFEQGKALPTIGAASTPEEPEPTATAAPVVTMTVDETAQSVSLTSDVDTDAVLVQASYVTDSTLDSVKVVPVQLTANTAASLTVANGDLDAFQTGDKFMVLDSLDTMRPLSVAKTVTGGAAQTTPEPEATEEVTTEPTAEATTEPTAEATTEPTTEATTEPTAEATTEPTAEATTEPTAEATTEPTTEATTEPTAEATTEPTAEATTEPTTEATTEPTAEATTEPTAEATTEPTTEPTAEATTEPTAEATTEPTAEATTEPTAEATTEPTTEATTEPTEDVPDEPTVYANFDFEDYNAGTVSGAEASVDGATGIASIPGFSGKVSAVVVGAEGQGNVLWLRGGGAWTPDETITESVKMEFDIHYGYYSGTGKTEIWNITNSAGEIIASVTYDATSCAITEVTIGGQKMDLTDVIAVQDKNEFYQQNSKAHTSVVLDTTNNAIKITLTKNGESSVFTGSLGEMTADFASWNFTNNVNYHSRCSTIDNFVVESTTETVDVAGATE